MTIQEWQIKHKIKTRHLARLLGISESAIWRIKNGTRCPRLALAKKIIELAGGEITLDDIYGTCETKEAIR